VLLAVSGRCEVVVVVALESIASCGWPSVVESVTAVAGVVVEVFVVGSVVVAVVSGLDLAGCLLILPISMIAVFHNFSYVLSSMLRSNISGQASINHTNGCIRMLT